MPERLELIRAYFAAKAVQYGGAPGFECREAGPLTFLHAVPGWPEVDAFYAVDLDPIDAVSAVRAADPDKRHALTVFDTTGAPGLAPYAQLGYVKAPGSAQPFMSLLLSTSTSAASSPVRTLRGREAEECLLACQGDRIVDPRHCSDNRIAYYCIEADGRPVCWGASLVAMDHIVYVFGVETVLDRRRMGLANALMSHIQKDAADAGFLAAILCASPDGFHLYSSMGYQTIAYMHMLVEA